MYTVYKSVRFSEKIELKINKIRGKKNFSEWIRDAAKMSLESEHGLTPKYADELNQFNREILALGRNLNQIARAVNSGISVSVDSALLFEIGKLLRETQQSITTVKTKLL